MTLSHKLSSSVRPKRQVVQTTPPQDDSPPPAYTTNASVAEPPDITVAFSNLQLRGLSSLPAADHCIAHLKLLEAFHQLREDIALRDGLFNLHDSYVPREYADADKAKILTQIREKRWATYIAKAVKRFECWWNVCVQPHAKKAEWSKPGSSTLNRDLHQGDKLNFDKKIIPPLDVVMVWHAYQLNPRNFLEDCIRHGKMDFWRTGLPWTAIDACINNETFEFEAPAEAVKAFVVSTELPWDSNNDPNPNRTTIFCPSTCGRSVDVAWTTADHPDMWYKGSTTEIEAERWAAGLADKKFRSQCLHCQQDIDHELLKLQKFGNDILFLQNDNVPIPGTILSINGKPELPISFDRHPSYFPNRLIRGGSSSKSKCYLELLQLCPQYRKMETIRNGSGTRGKADISAIRSILEKYLQDRSYIKSCNNTFTPKLQRAEKIAVRRMMSHYWDNYSTFGLDLVGAVIRQGAFVEKMHSIDWLHSPACKATMKRLITKYTRYIDIVASNPSSIAVPTLDVDLAWHTHQLSPLSYYRYSEQHTGTFIDHDDKIDETKLSTAFEWTSKVYQKMFNEIYSECTCWYCEAIRESHTSNLGRVFGSNKQINDQLDQLHKTPQPKQGATGPHISAHNAIKPDAVTSQAFRQVEYKAKLERDYQKVVQQARKKGRKPPTREDHLNAYWAYGYPIYVPYYAPYMGDPCVVGGMYPSNPSCATFVPGAAGNCCQGACGGGVAAGSCGGSGGGGGCAAGSMGGGCGGGGGGGGGCGGGGGGCGGGGGGCGGGGGG